MAKLYFENSCGDRRVIGNVNNHDEAYKVINSFLKDHNFKSRYIRTWEENGETCFDVGSHTEFFWLSLPLPRT